MKKSIIIALAVLTVIIAGCGEEKPKINQADIAGKAAVEYYGYLQRGDYAAFVDGLDYPNPIPKDYRAIHEKNAQMFMHEQDSLRGGIKTVKVSKADLTSGDSTTAAVYLTLGFGSGASEEVLVPMVKRNGLWRMK